MSACPPFSHDESRPDTDFLTAQTPYFDVYEVRTSAAMQQVMRLRYEVYCLERGIFDPRDYPDGLESDEFDESSVHFLARHRASGVVAGTVRLVLPSPRWFPLMAHCQFDPEYDFLTRRDPERLRSFGEVSRIAVSKRYRQRAGDTLVGGPPRAASEMREPPPAIEGYPSNGGPEIVAGLYKSVYQEWARRGLTDTLGAMERGFYLLLRRMRLPYEPVGPEIDYFGPVRPFVLNKRRLDQELLEHRPEVLRYWLIGLPEALWPVGAAELEQRIAAQRQRGPQGEMADGSSPSAGP